MTKTILSVILFSIAISLQLSAQSYEDLVNRSADYLEAKDYMAAEQTLKAALKKEPANPGNILLLSNLGTVQRHLKEYDEALLSYNVALTQYPNSVFLLHNRAALFCEIDSLNQALIDYNTILFSEHENLEALYRRGLIYLNKKDYIKAASDFEKIQQIDPKNLWGSMGLALIMKRNGQWDKAESLYSDLLYENRTNADLFLNRAECFLELKKLARAQEDLEKAISFGSKDPFLYILKGRISLQQYDKISAKTYFLKAEELGANKKIIEELLIYCK